MHRAVFRPGQLNFRGNQVHIDLRLWGLVAKALLQATSIWSLILAQFCGFCLLLAFWLCYVLEGLLKLLNMGARGIGWFTDIWICQFQISNLFQIWSQSSTLVYVMVVVAGRVVFLVYKFSPSIFMSFLALYWVVTEAVFSVHDREISPF